MFLVWLNVSQRSLYVWMHCKAGVICSFRFGEGNILLLLTWAIFIFVCVFCNRDFIFYFMAVVLRFWLDEKWHLKSCVKLFLFWLFLAIACHFIVFLAVISVHLTVVNIISLQSLVTETGSHLGSCSIWLSNVWGRMFFMKLCKAKTLWILLSLRNTWHLSSENQIKPLFQIFKVCVWLTKVVLVFSSH